MTTVGERLSDAVQADPERVANKLSEAKGRYITKAPRIYLSHCFRIASGNPERADRARRRGA